MSLKRASRSYACSRVALRVLLFGIRGVIPVTLGWKSSVVKLFTVSWVFVGGSSVSRAGGSAIGPGLAPARYTTQIYIAIISTTTSSFPCLLPSP